MVGVGVFDTTCLRNEGFQQRNMDSSIKISWYMRKAKGNLIPDDLHLQSLARRPVVRYKEDPHGPRSPVTTGQCLLCRQMSHFARDCPNRGSRDENQTLLKSVFGSFVAMVHDRSMTLITKPEARLPGGGCGRCQFIHSVVFELDGLVCLVAILLQSVPSLQCKSRFQRVAQQIHRSLNRHRLTAGSSPRSCERELFHTQFASEISALSMLQEVSSRGESDNECVQHGLLSQWKTCNVVPCWTLVLRELLVAARWFNM